MQILDRLIAAAFSGVAAVATLGVFLFFHTSSWGITDFAGFKKWAIIVGSAGAVLGFLGGRQLSLRFGARHGEAVAAILMVVAIYGPRPAAARSEEPNRPALPNYRCVVEQVVTAGQHNMTPLQQVDRQHVGARFSVERRTGLMSGALNNSYITRPEVIDFGSQDNSFKAVTTMRIEQGVGRGTNAYVLVINEFDRSAKKPFVFLDNDEVYFGTCVHQH